MEDVKTKFEYIFCKKVKIKPGNVKYDANLAFDLGLDSLDTVGVIMALEREYQLKIPKSNIAEIKTVADLLHLFDTSVKQYCSVNV